MENHPNASGLTGSVRRLAETLLGTVSNRLELAALELDEERQWMLRTFVWMAAALFLSFVAMVSLTFTVVLMTPEGARPWVMLGFFVLYLCAAAGAVLMVRRTLLGRPPPFADTLSELRKDAAALRGEKED